MDNIHTLHWFEFAEDDLDSAKILAEYGSRKINAVCFHAHQSAEKNLKGYLISEGVDEPPYIHNLPALKAMCEDYDSRFAEIAEQCARLNPYGVRVKYPNELVIDESDVKQAIADARAIHEFEPIAAVRAALETDRKEHYTVTETTATADSRPIAGKQQEPGS
jgi:HEPN domain-containing protein